MTSPLSLVVVIPLAVPLALAGVVLNFSRLAGSLEGADVGMGGPVESDDVVVNCIVEEESVRLEAAVVEQFPDAVCHRAEPFGPRSTDSSCEDSDSPSIIVNAC